jgi:hypothetical protein
MACICFGMDYEDKRVVRHSCNTPACINPAHLRVGTQRDNMQDMIQAGRDNFYGRRTTC